MGYCVECRAEVNEQHSNIGVFIFYVGKSQVEGGGNCIIRKAVWTVCKLERIVCWGGWF